MSFLTVKLFSPNWNLSGLNFDFQENKFSYKLLYAKTRVSTEVLNNTVCPQKILPACLSEWTEIRCNSKTKENTPKSSDRVTEDAWQSFMALCRMQWDDKFAAKRRVVLDSYFLEYLARDADVTQVNSASPLSQCKGEAKREGPLGLNRQALSTSWGV